MNFRATLILTLLFLLGGCLNEDLAYLTIQLDGLVLSDEEGPISVEFHHAVQGSDDLAHPLGWIDEIVLEAPRPFTHQLDYPLHRGSGLFVYAWQDLDGDGLLCSPGGASEPTGGSETTDSLSLQLTIEIALNESCLGPERLIIDNHIDKSTDGSI